MPLTLSIPSTREAEFPHWPVAGESHIRDTHSVWVGGGSEMKARPSPTYRKIRWLCRQISASWFREHDIVGEDLIPEHGGVLFAAWHPGALIDPLLMVSAIPGQLTFVAKHTLFKLPILGYLMRAAGAKPAYRKQDIESRPESSVDTSEPTPSPKGREGDPTPSTLTNGADMMRGGNQGLIESLSDCLGKGSWCAIYPEGISHLFARPQKTKTGPARIMLLAIRKAREAGNPLPSLVPVGLHYTDANRFRERALVSIHRPMKLPPLPEDEGTLASTAEAIASLASNEAADRAWVNAVTEMLGTELDRTSQGLDSWEDRKLLWRTRGLLSVHRNRATGRKSAATYSEAVLGARRTRAAWLWFSDEEPERANEIRRRVADHALRMDDYHLREHELYDRGSRPGATALLFAFAQIMVSWVLMLGLITWGALIGTYPPYRAAGLIAHRLSLKDENALGTNKIAVSFVLMPLWWFTISWPVAYLLASESSPLWSAGYLGVLTPLQDYLTVMNWVFLAFILMPLWAVAARLHLRLYRRSVIAFRTLKLWKRLRNREIPWDELSEEQRSLAVEIETIGNKLILPGDSDWVEPATGDDDLAVVRGG